MSTYNILILGASYGSLLASKILLGAHSVKLVCLPTEADLINSEGFRVRIPIRGRSEPIELDSRKLPGRVSAARATDVDPREYDLIGLAMQEPQYGSPGVRELMNAVATSRVPCMSIMNMPPFAYMRRVPGIDSELLKPAYTAPEVWEEFEKGNEIVRRLEKEIDAARFDAPEGRIQLPVKLRFYDSIFVPLAKWAMLMAGNYRCITEDGMRTAREAVHSDLEASRSIYDFVLDVCVKIGASRDELVPFERYAAAAESLSRPASAARALNNGASNIERADKLVQLAAKQKGMRHPALDAIVALVDRRLEANRKMRPAAA
ncbi:hypothetical protein [Bradyrhizobium sp. RDI18]|uniref:hypothetical protein n=1 Tax=Bradyrhizobium sp. RDI18 TaxID=3367400 RepID=UPI0037201A61